MFIVHIIAQWVIDLISSCSVYHCLSVMFRDKKSFTLTYMHNMHLRWIALNTNTIKVFVYYHTYCTGCFWNVWGHQYIRTHCDDPIKICIWKVSEFVQINFRINTLVVSFKILSHESRCHIIFALVARFSRYIRRLKNKWCETSICMRTLQYKQWW
jgi:hypothetical protein